MVEVFKTNVNEISQAKYLLASLLQQFPDYIINFDLNDCDKILRLEGEKIDAKGVIILLNQSSVS